MDLEQVVAWWAEKYLNGDMTGAHLVDALHELGDADRAALSDSDALRLSNLVREMRAAVGHDSELKAMGTLLSEFLGVRPSEVLEDRGTPDWQL